MAFLAARGVNDPKAADAATREAFVLAAARRFFSVTTRRKHEIARRPLMVTEWSFPALDAGLPCTKGCGQRVETQADRRAASVLCAQTMLSLPFLIGYDYFMWVDEPPLGVVKGFMENSNYGLVSEDGKPYAELTQAFAALHRDPVAARLRPPPVRRAQPEGVRTLAEVARAVGERGAAGRERTPARRDADDRIAFRHPRRLGGRARRDGVLRRPRRRTAGRGIRRRPLLERHLGDLGSSRPTDAPTPR